jgi:hypothetical protein
MADAVGAVNALRFAILVPLNERESGADRAGLD